MLNTVGYIIEHGRILQVKVIATCDINCSDKVGISGVPVKYLSPANLLLVRNGGTVVEVTRDQFFLDKHDLLDQVVMLESVEAFELEVYQLMRGDGQ